MLTLESAGYKRMDARLILTTKDILPGHFTRETRIKAKSTQKADFAVCLRKSQKLLLIEAKAVGVELDAFKRIKECREKASSWKSHFGKNVLVGTVLAGFFPPQEILSLVSHGVNVFWEHQLDDLKEFAKKA